MLRGLEVLFLVLAGATLLTFPREGALSDLHARFLAQVLYALDRGRLETLGFAYPPLPLLLLLPWPGPWGIALWGGLALGGVGLLLLREARDRGEGVLLLLPLVLFLSPLAWTVAQADLASTLGLFLLLLAWRRYVTYAQTGLVVHAFVAGLILALAGYATPLALPLGVAFALGLGLFRPLSPPAWAAGALVLLFPLLLGLGTWAYLAWLFTQSPAFLYQGLRGEGGVGAALLPLAAPYLATGAILLGRPSPRLLLYASPLLVLGSLGLLGNPVPATALALLLTLFAASALPLRLLPWQRGLLALAALVQGLAAWTLLPPPEPNDPLAQALARSLREAPPLSVLAEEDTAYPLVALAGTARPFLLPQDPGYGLALAAPALLVERILLCPGVGTLGQRYGSKPPPGFAVEGFLPPKGLRGTCLLLGRTLAAPRGLPGP